MSCYLLCRAIFFSAPCDTCRATPYTIENLYEIEGLEDHGIEDSTICFVYMCQGDCPTNKGCKADDPNIGYIRINGGA